MSDQRPVTLVLTGPDEPHDVFDFVFAAAEQRGADLVVIAHERQPTDPATSVTAWETGRAEALDVNVAPWQDRHPHVGVIVELRRTAPQASELVELARESQLLVVV